MRLKTFILSLTAAAGLWACQSNSAPAAEEGAAEKAEYQEFGASISPDNAMSFDDMLTKLAGADSVEVKVRARVDAVCQAKGCWMDLSNGNDATAMKVRFKDYGFFVPKDISGRDVIVQGYAYRSVTPVDELKHLAQDAGKTQEEIEAITEPKEELKFLASGVLLLEQ